MASPPEQPPPQPMDDSPANNLILTLRQVSISPSATEKQRTFSLREFEILQTIGTGMFGRVMLVHDVPSRCYYALKVMNVAAVIRLKQIEHVISEKDILKCISHPFIVNLQWTHHDNRFLYMLLDYVPGGELFSYLRAAERFNSSTAIFYTAEIVTALEYLHAQNIVYRDLKPENIILEASGHIRIADFGFAKRIPQGFTYTLCGTPEYLAPEIIQGRGHGKAVDWWALGVLVYEMLVGYPPFFDEHHYKIYEKILEARVDFPKFVSVEKPAMDLIRKLLTVDRTKRVGAMRHGAEDVKNHKWFKGINWDQVLQRGLVPPILPRVAHPGDTNNFDKYPEDGWLNAPPLSDRELGPFADF